MSGKAGEAAGEGATSTVPYGQLAGIGLGIGSSLLQASQQSAAARNFQGQQQKAIEEAKRQAGANFMQNISAPTEAYQAAMREGTAQQMQALQAGTEGDVRNLQGIVGRTNEAATDFDFGQRDKMAQDLYQLHMDQAKEQKQSATNLAGIGLEEAKGAGLAKQQAEKAKALANANALGGVEKLGLLWDQSRKAFPTQPNAQTTYNRSTDPMLANINNYNAPQQTASTMVGPQEDTRGFSSVDDRFPVISQIDWSLFNHQ
jgi:hypothetical protein